MADPKAIHEFLTGEVEATTLILGDFVDLDAQSGYTTYKASVSDLGEVILEDIEYTQDLTTVDKTIIGAINENKSVIGYSYDEYDATTAYSTDDLCIYNNTLYKALQATTGNLPTNTTYWEQTSIADEIGRIDTALSDTDSKINYLRSKFIRGNYTTFTFTLPDIFDGSANINVNFNHMTLVIGYNAFAILICAYSQSAISVVSLGTNTITATKQANSFEVTVNLADTSWGGIRVITLD